MGLTPCYEKELAVKALGGCIYVLKDYLLDQQLLAPKRFNTFVPPDSCDGNEGSRFQNNMVGYTRYSMVVFGIKISISILGIRCSYDQ